jgi:hypothetical protein
LPDSAQQDVIHSWGAQGSGLIEIEDIRFGYFELGWDDAQSYLQPAYILPLTITATDGPFSGHIGTRSEHLVAAATHPPEPLIPRRRPLQRRLHARSGPKLDFGHLGR